MTQADLRYPTGFALALAPLPPEHASHSKSKPAKKR
ncbi:cell division protein [Bordetella pertussis]|nr:cell division protein [Bordetella pertussis]CFO77271.1 cell division protein [Bordetella pertussis]CPL12779.1 cell division protein [Bordetella pertussis]CPN63213.1 cell division protein [Bordetella pertussis]